MSKKNRLNTAGKIQEHLKDLNRWSLYKKGMCETCEGLCCYMPVEIKTADLIRMGILDEFHLELSLKEQIKEALKHPGVTRYTPSTEKFTLAQKPDSSCFFLDANKRCTIYGERPDTCRNHPKIGPRPNYCAYMKKEN
ncbi:YkgJ family cysteine cluster protein [Bacteriovorax stolpii]|uniref:YkgJ family cysteine cluster protein n=1 Tax=Bacteriovorax stolpii TaxID=960 RepID=UPI001158CDC0|nr:YkgJ family cysteine cluster protein [Bacteriovorax stolpii]QDK42480.1 YkgJ family cysteine cluster protein [Bacteriovorax stolpii]